MFLVNSKIFDLNYCFLCSSEIIQRKKFFFSEEEIFKKILRKLGY